jgi:HPt (histidine-containing phosphotransfer) domain-containing protein
MSPLEAKLAELRSRLAARLVDEHAAFETLLAIGDRQGLAARAHKLAGIAGMLGAAEVGELAQELEEDILAGADFAVNAANLIALLGTYSHKP